MANRYWSFRHRERTSVAREGVIFFVLNGVGLLIQDAVVAFNFYILGNGHNKAAEFIALNVGIALATLFRFWSYRKWVWAAPADAAGDRAERPRRPQPSASPSSMAHSSAPAHAPGQNGNGHAPPPMLAPGLLHANGHGGNGQSEGAHSAPSSRNGWDS